MPLTPDGPGMLTSYLTQDGPQNNCMAQNVNSAAAEKPYLTTREKVSLLLSARKMKSERMATPQYILHALP